MRPRCLPGRPIAYPPGGDHKIEQKVSLTKGADLFHASCLGLQHKQIQISHILFDVQPIAIAIKGNIFMAIGLPLDCQFPMFALGYACEWAGDEWANQHVAGMSCGWERCKELGSRLVAEAIRRRGSWNANQIGHKRQENLRPDSTSF